MRSKTEILSSKRSVINHSNIITDETFMVGVYRVGGALSIYAESLEGVENFSIDRGNSLDMVYLTETLVGTWVHTQLPRTMELAEKIRELRAASHEHLEKSVTHTEFNQFIEVFKEACKESIGNQSEIDFCLQNALSKLNGAARIDYKPRYKEQCTIL